MIKQFGIASLAIMLMGSNTVTNAQELDLEGLRRNIAILSAAMEEALELNVVPSLFSINSGQVSSIYLRNQGVVLEIRSPLANQRNRMSLGALVSSIEELQSRPNPFAVVAAPEFAPPVERMTIQVERGNMDEFRRSMINQINNLDVSSIVNSSLRQITQAARSLRDLGEISEADLETMRQESERIRSLWQEQSSALRELETDLQTHQEDSADTDSHERNELQEKVNSLVAEFELLKQEAMDKAAELQQRNEQAKIRYAEQWQERVAQFETDLFSVLCDYATSLRDLPEDEFVTVVLNGLGGAESEGRTTDKIHVIRKPELMACQSREIDAPTLMLRASSYNY